MGYQTVSELFDRTFSLEHAFDFFFGVIFSVVSRHMGIRDRLYPDIQDGTSECDGKVEHENCSLKLHDAKVLKV
jgi:hypothetical protein